MPDFTRLRAVDDIMASGLMTTVEENMADFLRWSFLEAGGFVNRAVATPGVYDAYGGDRFYPVHKDGAVDNTIWQSQHPDWCYETGLDYDIAPVVANGVYVDGTSYPTAATVGAFAHTLDFPHGRVVFDSPVSPSAVVQVSYSSRYVGVFTQDIPWFRDVVLDGFLTEQSKGGVVALLDDYRVTTPLVVVEAVLGRKSVGRELGSSVSWRYQDVLFHVVAASKAERDRIADALLLLKDRTVYLYDVNARREASDYPVDWRGSRSPNADMYPDLLSDYPYRKAYFADTAGSEVDASLPLFRGVVRATLVAAL